MAYTQDPPQDLEPLLNAEQEHLSLLFSDSEAIDNKTLGIAAINVAILIFIGQASLQLQNWQLAALIGPYLISLALNIATIWPRRYEGPGVDIDTHPEYLAMDKETLVMQLLSDTFNAVQNNTVINNKRWRLCVISIVCSALGTGVLFAIL